MAHESADAPAAQACSTADATDPADRVRGPTASAGEKGWRASLSGSTPSKRAQVKDNPRAKLHPGGNGSTRAARDTALERRVVPD